MVLTEQVEVAWAEGPEIGRSTLRNDILWDDEAEQNEASLTSDPTPLGPGADRRLVLVGVTGATATE